MMYPRRDFRPDHLPRMMTNLITTWTMSEGKKTIPLSSRAATVHRRDYKTEHQGRQRSYDRKVVREAWSEYQNEKGGE